MSDIIIKAVQSGLISPQSLQSLMQDNTLATPLKILDASAVLPGAAINPYNSYCNEHISGARFFDIEEISDHTNSLPHMLPSAADFSIAAGNLGLENKDFIVLYGQSGIVMGPARVWWMFRYFGHDRVAVLNGGLPAWKAENYSVSHLTHEEILFASNKSFKVEIKPGLLASIEDVKAASIQKMPLILDARPAARFNGTLDEPRAGLEKGHIPSSLNIPASILVDENTGKLKSDHEIDSIFSIIDQNYKTIPFITTCGSGITACVIALALFHNGNKNAVIYDGSWAEWGNKKINKYLNSNNSLK